MPKTNWLGRLSAHLCKLGNRGWGKSSRGLQLRQRRGGSLYSTVPAMIEVLESRRVLSGASVTDLAFVQDAVVPGMVTAHGQITGTVTGVSSDGSETAWIEIDRSGDGSVDGTTGVNGDSFSYETDASYGSNLFKIRVVVSDGMAMTITPGDWQDFAFNVTAPPNLPPTVTNLSFTVENNSSGMVTGRLEGDVDDDGSSPCYEIQIDRNDDGIPDEWDSALGTSPVHFTHANMTAVVGSNTVKVRAVESDPATGMPLEGVWVALTFNVDPPTDNKPTIDQLSYSPRPGSDRPQGRDGEITGILHDDGVTYTDYRVQLDHPGGVGEWDYITIASQGAQFTIPTGRFLPGSHTVRLRPVEVDATGAVVLEGDWVDVTFTVSNGAPTFPIPSDTKDVDCFIGDEYPLPFATDPDTDSISYTFSAVPPGTEFVGNAPPGLPIAHRLRVVDAAAFRAAVATGAVYTLTATDTFGLTGTTQIKFRLAPGSTVTASATATPLLIERIDWDYGGRNLISTALATANVTVSAVTATNPMNGGLLFNQPVVNVSSDIGSLADHPEWNIVAGLPTITSSGVYRTPDQMNETLIVVVSQVVKVMHGTTVVARIPYDIVFTLSTTGAATTGIGPGTPTFDPAYSPRRTMRISPNMLSPTLLGTSYLSATVDLQ